MVGAIELLHSASLLLDDLPVMDNAGIRRKQPTAHVLFGEIQTLATAFWLADLSSEVLIEGGTLWTSYGEEIRRRFSATKTHMLRGQLLDLSDQSQELDRLLTKCRLKSGELYGFACMLASLLADEPSASNDLYEFGCHLGTAYQIADDLLDITGDPDKIGKPVNQDVDKPTIPRIYGQQEALRLKAEYRRKAFDHLNRLSGLDEIKPIAEAIWA